MYNSAVTHNVYFTSALILAANQSAVWRYNQRFMNMKRWVFPDMLMVKAHFSLAAVRMHLLTEIDCKTYHMNRQYLLY